MDLTLWSSLVYDVSLWHASRCLAGLGLRVGSTGIQQSYYAMGELLGGPDVTPGPEIRTTWGEVPPSSGSE